MRSPSTSRHLVAALLLFTVVAACGEDAPEPSISISVDPTSVSVLAGSTATATVDVTREGGYDGPVTLTIEGLPSGITASFAPATLSPSTSSAVVTFTASATAASGPASVTIRGRGDGDVEDAAPVTLTVARPGIAVATTGTTITLVKGASATLPVTLTRTSYSGDVLLSADNLPAGVTASFSPPTLTGTTTASTLTLTASASATAATAPFGITATGTGVTPASTTVSLTITEAASPAISLTATPAAVSVTASASATTAIGVTRTGGFTGAVGLAVTGAPTGVTATLAPATVAGGATTSTLTLAAAAGTVPGTYPLTVSGTGTGATAGTTGVTLTVTAAPSFTLAVSPAAVSVTRGGTATTTVTLTRSPGFTADVALAIAPLPAGVTAAFAPPTLTGGATTSTLTLTASGSAAVGTTSPSVSGTGGGTTASQPVSLTVAAGGGTTQITWRFCEATTLPLWFAVQQGTSGPWVTITGTGTTTRTYTFDVGSVAGVAYAVPTISGNGTQVAVIYATGAELVGYASAECAARRAKKSLTGTVTGLEVLDQAIISLGGASATTTPGSSAYSLANVDDGVSDLLAIRNVLNQTTGLFNADRGVLRRNVNYPANSAIPAINFATEGFDVASALYTVEQAGSDLVGIITTFTTPNGAGGNFVVPFATTANVYRVYGVPATTTLAGDLHRVTANAVPPSGGGPGQVGFRSVSRYNRDLAARTVTLGPTIPAPSVTSLGTAPYPRLRATSQWASDYDDYVLTTYGQETGSQNNWTLTVTRGYTGNAADWTLAFPDFTGVTGFSATWALANSTIGWTMIAFGVFGGFDFSTRTYVEDSGFRNVAVGATITP